MAPEAGAVLWSAQSVQLWSLNFHPIPCPSSGGLTPVLVGPIPQSSSQNGFYFCGFNKNFIESVAHASPAWGLRLCLRDILQGTLTSF